MRYLIAFLLMVSLPVHGQALWRNFFSTNQNPRVTVVAGSNATVQASTVGVDQRIFTVNSVPPTNVAFAGYATNSGFATNANFATNASNATNLWGVLNPTNIPSLNYISNNAGFGTNTTIFGTLNTSNEVLTLSGIGTTISPIFWLTNPAVAALGAQQASPALMLSGNGWRSGNSTTMPVQMGMYVLPVQGSSANPTATFEFIQSISNAAPTQVQARVYNNGSVEALQIFSTGYFQAGAASYYSHNGRNRIYSPADGITQLINNGLTGFTGLVLGINSDNWLRLKVESSTNNPTLSIRTGADGNYAALVSSNHIIPIPNLGTTIQPALWLTNSTDAALGAQQASPALMLGGQGWRSGNSTTMPVQMGFYTLPTQGSSANPLGSLVVISSISNAAPTSSGITMFSSGAFGAGDITSSGNILAQSTSSLGHNSRSILKSPVDSAFQMMNNASTAFSYLLLGRLADDWLRLKVEASTNNPTLSIRTGADGNYASLVASNVLTSGTMNPTNGVVFQGKHAITTNFTAVESIQLYNCNGTNLVITLPNCTNSTPWKIYRFAQTNSWASFTLTNANGLQTIHNGIDLSYSIRSAKQTAVYHDGAHWWLAVPDQPNFPNAQFSCSTNIPLTAANTAYPVTFNSTDFNNSLGIGLGLGTNGLHSKMWLTNAGVYEFGPSVVQSFNGNDTIRFWFRTFDTNVPASSTPSKGQNGSIRVITVPFIISVTQPTPVEIWAQSDTTGEELPAEAASGNYPAAPCVICPVKMISHPWP